MREAMRDKQYLGDGVYAQNDGFHIWLTVEDGIDVQHKIALEPQVLAALDRYRAALSPDEPEEGAPDA